jgi:hypothetical protein
MRRSNADLAGWHWSVHFCRYQAHIHRGPWVMVRDRYGRTTGQIARPLGWFTGQEPVAKAQLDAEFRNAHRRSGVDTGSTGRQAGHQGDDVR